MTTRMETRITKRNKFRKDPGVISECRLSISTNRQPAFSCAPAIFHFHTESPKLSSIQSNGNLAPTTRHIPFFCGMLFRARNVRVPPVNHRRSPQSHQPLKSFKNIAGTSKSTSVFSKKQPLCALPKNVRLLQKHFFSSPCNGRSIMRQRIPFFLLAFLMVAFSGCLFFSSRTSYYRSNGRPPLLTPWNRPADLFSSDNYADSELQTGEDLSATVPREANESAPVAAGLEMTIKAPRQRQVGSPAAFQLTLYNNGRQPLTDVVVESAFDSAMQFPGSEETTVRRPLGTILPGATKTFSLHLTGTQAGRWCSRFSVSSRGRETSWKSVCVEFVPRRVNLTLTGPEKLTLGDRAEYLVHVENRSEQDLGPLEINVYYPNQLFPVDGTRGIQPHPGELVWYPENLPPGEGLEFRVVFEYRGLSEQVCVTAELLENELPLENAQSCLKIDRNWRKTREPTASRHGESPSRSPIRLDRSPTAR